MEHRGGAPRQSLLPADRCHRDRATWTTFCRKRSGRPPSSLLLGPHFAWLETQIFATSPDILIAILPPGAFMALGFLIVIKRIIDNRVRQPADTSLVQLQS